MGLNEDLQSLPLSLQTFAQDGTVVHFKAKVTTPFRKLMTAYCERQSVTSESVVFLFEGERLRGEQTPQEVNSCTLHEQAY